jgi:hypothetical protein
MPDSVRQERGKLASWEAFYGGAAGAAIKPFFSLNIKLLPKHYLAFKTEVLKDPRLCGFKTKSLRTKPGGRRESGVVNYAALSYIPWGKGGLSGISGRFFSGAGETAFI